MSTAVKLIALRPGGPADLPQVNEIMQDAFDARYGEAWTQSQCLGMLSLPGVWLTLADVDETAVGFALARETAQEGELLLLATRRSAQGCGVGSALLRAVIAEARARNVRRLHLEVRERNDAVRIYRREGFEKVGERRDYYRGNTGQVFNAYTYARSLD